ncbi:MAG: sugar ABC transporter substrate-binding protein [Treponema sp.]|nr:sugar ABC transporter substrate-binding protein [Treponema sp.]
MKKLVLGLIVLVLIFGIFTGCTRRQEAGGAAGSVVEVTFWDENPGPERTPYLEQIINWYHESQNRVRVRYVGVPQAEAITKINVAVAGNAVPDISGLQAAWLSGLIAQRALMQLDDPFAAWNESPLFDPASISGTQLRDPAGGGLFLMPMRSSLFCIWYRIDRFAEAGVEIPQTWDEFFDVIAKLTNPAIGQYGFAIRGSGGADQLQTLLFAYTGITEYIDENGRAAFRDPSMVEFLTRYAGIYNRYTAQGDVNYNFPMMVAAFGTGAANMIQHNLGSLADHQRSLQAGTFGTFMFPKSIRGYHNLPLPNYQGYVIFEGSKNKEATLDFLKFLTGEKSMSYFNEMIGEFPVRQDVQSHEWVQNSDHLRNVVAVMQLPETNFVSFPQHLPDYTRIINEIANPGWQAVMLGRRTPADFLDEWATAIERAHQRWENAMN